MRFFLVVGWLWAGLVTGAAWLVLRLLGADPYDSTWSGIALLCRWQSPLQRWMQRKGVMAMTWGCVAVYREPRFIGLCRAHEEEHVRQWMVFGPFTLLAVALSAAWTRLRGRPARDHWFERCARER